MLIDCYTRFLALVPTSREVSIPSQSSSPRADAKVRRIIVQGAVKEFEDHSRASNKSEVAGVGRVVLGGFDVKRGTVAGGGR